MRDARASWLPGYIAEDTNNIVTWESSYRAMAPAYLFIVTDVDSQTWVIFPGLLLCSHEMGLHGECQSIWAHIGLECCVDLADHH